MCARIEYQNKNQNKMSESSRGAANAPKGRSLSYQVLESADQLAQKDGVQHHKMVEELVLLHQFIALYANVQYNKNYIQLPAVDADIHVPAADDDFILLGVFNDYFKPYDQHLMVPVYGTYKSVLNGNYLSILYLIMYVYNNHIKETIKETIEKYKAVRTDNFKKAFILNNALIYIIKLYHNKHQIIEEQKQKLKERIVQHYKNILKNKYKVIYQEMMLKYFNKVYKGGYLYKILQKQKEALKARYQAVVDEFKIHHYKVKYQAVVDEFKGIYRAIPNSIKDSFKDIFKDMYKSIEHFKKLSIIRQYYKMETIKEYKDIYKALAYDLTGLYYPDMMETFIRLWSYDDIIIIIKALKATYPYIFIKYSLDRIINSISIKSCDFINSCTTLRRFIYFILLNNMIKTLSKDEALINGWNIKNIINNSEEPIINTLKEVFIPESVKELKKEYNKILYIYNLYKNGSINYYKMIYIKYYFNMLLNRFIKLKAQNKGKLIQLDKLLLAGKDMRIIRPETFKSLSSYNDLIILWDGIKTNKKKYLRLWAGVAALYDCVGVNDIALYNGL